MSFNLNTIKQHCDHPEDLEQVYNFALSASSLLPENYIFVETGTRGGGSALAILQAIRDSGKQRWLFTIDPYGEKPYNIGTQITDTLHYGEALYREAMKALSDYSFEHEMLHSHFRMKSLDWMRAFDNSEYWYNGERLKSKFGFAYLDGDHDSATVLKEYSWLIEHTPGCQIVVDDAHYLTPDIQKLGAVLNDRLFIGVRDESERD